MISFLINSIGNSQSTSKCDFLFGYGFYEGYYLGGEYSFKKATQSISLSVGYDRLLNKEQECFNLGLGYDFVIFKNHKNILDKYQWSISNMAVLWQLEDEFYLWRAVSLIPSIRRKFVIIKRINMYLDVGPSFTIVLYNKRKTFREVGWPNNYMPNFRVAFIL
jgi:hypothetical protein